MISYSITRLAYLCEIIPPLLMATGEPAFSSKPAPGSWSKKQIIGHLIDSANNNHQRFVRAQYEHKPTIFYDQDKWNTFSRYDAMEGQLVIDLWAAYNMVLIELIKNIPTENLQRGTLSQNGAFYTIEFLINDYLSHMEHHLQHVVAY